MVLRTALYDSHVAAGARFIEFGGWEMPLQYQGIVEEHLAVRKAAGLFDVSHMGKFLVDGAGAHAFLDGLSANALSGARGRATYTHLLREDGSIIDDVIVTCLGTESYFLVCNAGARPAVLEWLGIHSRGAVRIRDLTMDQLCLALQGPLAPDLLQRFTSVDLDDLEPFRGAILDFRIGVAGERGAVETEGWGTPPLDSLMEASKGLGKTSASGGPCALVTRTGYTGEPGFELFPTPALGRRIWTALLSAGGDLGLRPIGLGARDTLRLEKGFLLSGQDFDGSQTPFEVHCAWVVKFGRPFIGRAALEAQRSRDDYHRLVGLRMADRGIPRRGCQVLEGGRPAGVVTSGTMSPSLRVGIALASVGKIHATPSASLHVEIRGVPHPAVVVRLPFL
ncbi:MAG TPA: glycine cleavage system aminomethyltransferase GcvT [Thermoplasmata archaeon]|jgi:aminomethyltransferase